MKQYSSVSTSILRVRCDKITVTCLFTHQRDKERKTLQLLPWHAVCTAIAGNMEGCQRIRRAAKVMSYEVDIREMGSIKWEQYDLHHSPSICFSHHQCLSSASHAAKETLCVNSLIRKTLTCGSHPLLLLILVGKYFIDFFFFSFFCSSRRREEPRRALCGIRLCGGLL